MKNKLFTIAALLAVMVLITGIASANTGAVWAVNSTGYKGDYFDLGTGIYIDGQNLAANTLFSWSITDQNSPLPDDQKPIMAKNDTLPLLYTDSNGNINRLDTGWSIPADDHAGHDYKLRVVIYEPQGNGNKEKPFYTKIDTFYPIPEFPTVALPIAAVLGLVFFFQHRKKKEE